MHTEDIPVHLSSDVGLVVDMAREFVGKHETLSPGADVIRLAFQGKMLDERLKVGNYARDDAIFQIFKLGRNV